MQRPREATPPDGFADFVAARSDALLRSAWLLTADGGRAEDLLQTVPRLTQPADRVGEVAARMRRRRQRLVGSSALAVAAVVALGVGGAQLIADNQAPPHRTSSDSDGQRHWTSCTDAAPAAGQVRALVGTQSPGSCPDRRNARSRRVAASVRT